MKPLTPADRLARVRGMGDLTIDQVDERIDPIESDPLAGYGGADDRDWRELAMLVGSAEAFDARPGWTLIRRRPPRETIGRSRRRRR